MDIAINVLAPMYQITDYQMLETNNMGLDKEPSIKYVLLKGREVNIPYPKP